ncbi:multidrug effflux MFS transporter [Vagococcus intermedius]|uniref:Bcr/CflA family efflux transporter n=1 Tax=Vagococcus intermedius TaxID=2991418 RepID=A0AAF0CW76_9ENTE|nr:multidrug effflux MFS transporter [Vagococcus intermedius]WEG73999.1 multidrug effflux MFS transporter [Vagococcus intermedius]WEG76079.1 multidrug effflux MFS transporter [Vagococcus intermedius]
MRKNIKKQPGVLLLIVLVGFPQISETIFTPSLPQIATAYGVAINTAQLTLSIYFLAFAFGVFTWGWLSDSIGRRKAMNYGILIYGLGSLMCYLSGSMTSLLVARFIQAFGASTGSITTQTILRESYEGNERHSLFAKISAALAFTPAIGPLIGGFVGESFGYRAVFFTLVLMSVGVFAYSYLSLPETFVPETKTAVSLSKVARRLISNPRVVTFGIIIGGINGLLFSYYAEAPYVFIEYFGMTQSHYGFLGIMIALATVIGSLLSKRLLAHFKPEMIIRGGLSLAFLGAVALLVVTCLSGMASWIQMGLYIITVFIILVGTGISLPNCLSLALVDFKDVVGTAGAIFSLAYYLLVSLCTFLMSVLHTGSLINMPLYFIALIGVQLMLSKRYLK